MISPKRKKRRRNRDSECRASGNGSPIRGEGEDVHGANVNADSTLDAGRIGVVEVLLILGKSHDIDADLAVLGALGARNALRVRDDLQPSVPAGEKPIVGRKWTPVSAPDLAAKERIERNRDDGNQPEIDGVVISLPPDVVALGLVETNHNQTHNDARS